MSLQCTPLLRLLPVVGHPARSGSGTPGAARVLAPAAGACDDVVGDLLVEGESHQCGGQGRTAVAVRESGEGAGRPRQSQTCRPATIDSDPAARLLLLWGRRPGDPSRWYSHAGVDTLRKVRAVLGGY